MPPERVLPRAQQCVELTRAANHGRPSAGVERIERRIGVPLAEQFMNRLRHQARPREPQRGRPRIGMPFEHEPRIVADQNLSWAGQPQQPRRRGGRRHARHVRRMREHLPDVNRGGHFDPPALFALGSTAAGGRRRRQPRAPGDAHHVERRPHRAAGGPVDVALQAEMEQQRVAEPSARVCAVTDRDIGALRQPLFLVAVERHAMLGAGMALAALSSDRHAAAQRGDLPVLAHFGERFSARRKRVRTRLPAGATGVELADQRGEVERTKLRRERLGRRGTLPRILVQRMPQYRAERQRRDRRRKRDIHRAQLLIENLGHAGALHDDLARQAFEHDQAPRIQVAGGRRRLVAQLLRRAVRRRAEYLGRERHGPARDVFGTGQQRADAEIEQLRVRPVVGDRDHDVLRLQIAMHDAAPMSGRERVEHLRHQPPRVDGRQRPVRREPVAHRPALDQFEYGEQPPVGRFAAVQQRHDVRMPQRLAQARLAPEARTLVHALRRGQRGIVAHQLDGDGVPRLVAGRPKHHAVAAFAEQRAEPVMPFAGERRKRRRVLRWFRCIRPGEGAGYGRQHGRFFRVHGL
ncbi:hypothetical protein P355_1950 [Burkholderia cenocepacia KC-01]|nr:hypothetical protein P355_1950 [Burkholderia cenocepacia KC-01]